MTAVTQQVQHTIEQDSNDYDGGSGRVEVSQNVSNTVRHRPRSLHSAARYLRQPPLGGPELLLPKVLLLACFVPVLFCSGRGFPLSDSSSTERDHSPKP